MAAIVWEKTGAQIALAWFEAAVGKWDMCCYISLHAQEYSNCKEKKKKEQGIYSEKNSVLINFYILYIFGCY